MLYKVEAIMALGFRFGFEGKGVVPSWRTVSEG